jgi:ABC-2 type transport system permease protein
MHIMIRRLRKYSTVFAITWQKELEYRFNFVLGRMRNIIVMLLLFFLWTSLTMKSGKFAGYTQQELITYVFGINILRSVVFGTQSRQVAADINDGMFSTFLIMPMNHFFRTFSAELAQRSISSAMATVEVVLFAVLMRVDLLLQRDGTVLALFFLSLILATILYFLLSYLMSLFAFWSREAMGPRFLFDWILEFASGAYFPLDILSRSFFTALQVLPFASIVYLPMQIYLGRYSFREATAGILFQAAWIAFFSVVVGWVWRRGLRKYTGEGM